MFPKPEKPVKDPAYLSLVRQLPCLVCGRYPSEPHHAKHGRGGRSKSSDHDAIPLCAHHHRGPGGIEAGAETFHTRYGWWDTDKVKETRWAVERLRRNMI
jgi:hypothetical protein